MGEIGRNDTCPCGSGKKYKRCCGRNAYRPIAESDAPDTRITKPSLPFSSPFDPTVQPPPPWVMPPNIRYGPVGKCIYCGAENYDSSGSRRLGDEHIIP